MRPGPTTVPGPATGPALTPGVVRDWVVSPDAGAFRWQQCHASTVMSVGGRLLCAWFAGTEEGTPDNRIWGAVRDAEGSWSEARVIAGTGDTAHWNPVLCQGPDGHVWLFYKRGGLISGWSTWVSISRDSGDTWAEPFELVPGDAGGRGPVKNPPITADGAWLAPASLESWAPEGVVWESFVDRSEDGGITWAPSPIPLDRTQLKGAGIIQPSLWSAGSRVGALLRSTEGMAYVSMSADGGRTFQPAVATNLPNNNSGLTLVQLPDGGLACVHNPTTDNWGARCPLSIAFSQDGHDWYSPGLTIEDGTTPLQGHAPGRPGQSATGFQPRDGGVRTDGTGEYSYPSAVLHGDQLIITYTWQRRGIACASVPLELLATHSP